MLDNQDKNIVLKISGLHKSFGSKVILDNVNLSLHKNETVVVLGRSGTGKSVILKCIVGLISPDSGTIEINGKDTKNLTGEDLSNFRCDVGFLFQSGALYDSMSVRENLEFPVIRQNNYNGEDVTSKVVEQLQNVSLADSIDKMPSELSGGMRKRIGLARTLMLNPDIILYDEPTTGLDTFTSKEISTLIVKMKEKYGVSSIVITHDMPCAKMIADRIVVLKDGKFVAQGTYDELSQSPDDFIRSFFSY
ncbi:MAG TPA: ABC transporter ATP-binding protein [Bacteroidetes bacterium]|nr:ABC transporter ATP-binding protein [Bacteroidota bacterium]HCN38386.1 ABC transporter ATP-binding protein [Bacteroidota bacterium]